MGYSKKDIKQIEEAITKTTYELNDKKISRSAFHWFAVRNSKKRELVYFNSSKLFK
jgi:hypothetical protein